MPSSEHSLSDQAIRILVTGRVQGVGYRFFVRTTARALGIRGFVRNLPDGRVEVVAVAPSRMLDQLVQELEVGPAGAAVRQCQVVPQERVTGYRDFSIGY